MSVETPNLCKLIKFILTGKSAPSHVKLCQNAEHCFWNLARMLYSTDFMTAQVFKSYEDVVIISLCLIGSQQPDSAPPRAEVTKYYVLQMLLDCNSYHPQSATWEVRDGGSWSWTTPVCFLKYDTHTWKLKRELLKAPQRMASEEPYPAQLRNQLTPDCFQNCAESETLCS